MRNHAKHLTVVLCLLLAAAWILPRPRGHREAVAPAESEALEVKSSAPVQTFTRLNRGNPQAEPTAAVPQEEKTDSPAPKAVDAFNRWFQEYAAAPVKTAQVEATGERLAMERREAMADLIETDPEAALRIAVPYQTRKQLPPSIARHLEKRVIGEASFSVIASLPVEGRPETPAIQRYVTMNGTTYKAHVYGRRLTQNSRNSIPLHGIALGSSMAVAEYPVRRLEPGELEDLGGTTPAAGGQCPVSRKPGTAKIAAQLGSKVIYLCHDGHIDSLNAEIAAEEEAFRGPKSASNESWTHGNKSLLLMRVNFPDDLREQISLPAAQQLMRDANSFLSRNSYGLLSISATVTPVLTLPHPRSWYWSGNGLGVILEDARRAAEAAGFESSSFDLDCVHVDGSVVSPQAYVGMKGASVQSTNVETVCHELGHNLGLKHANGWKTTDGSIVGSGSNIEYGNSFDTMGSGGQWHHDFNICYKYRLNWVSEAAIHTVTQDGVYRLYPFDVAKLEDGRAYALKISKDGDREYWIETRAVLNAVPGSGGLLVNWGPWSKSDGASQLLDSTPKTDGGFFDAPVSFGRSFFDPELGLKIAPVSHSDDPTGPVDVLVTHVSYLAFANSGGGDASFEVQIPTAGDYAVWLRTFQQSPGSTPVTLLLDGWDESTVTLTSSKANQWSWNRATAAPLSLTAGGHTVAIRGLNANSRLDSIIVTDDPTSDLPPVITPITDQVTTAGRSVGPIDFTVVFPGGSAAPVQITATSSDQTILPNQNILVEGTNLNRTVTLVPVPERLGTARVTLTANLRNGASGTTAFTFSVIGPVQAAINAAADGETITVSPGTYNEHLVINRSITLAGAAGGETVFDGKSQGTALLTIASNTLVTVQNLTFTHGRGAVRNFGQSTFSRCSIRDNNAYERGAGFWNAPGATLILDGCTISGNRSSVEGGGIFNAGETLLSNCTVSGNRSVAKEGGGIFNVQNLSITSTTITLNRASKGGGLSSQAFVEMGNSIVAGNLADQRVGPDLKGEIGSIGYNLVGDTQGCTISGDTTGQILNRDPRLGPLQGNGGETMTHALLPDSPAIDAGQGTGELFDQRGYPRLVDTTATNATDGTDIGAVEYIAPEDAEGLVPYKTVGARLSTRMGKDGSVTVVISGASGRAWLIQATSDLTNWETIGQVNGSSATAEVPDPAARTLERRFYRALVY